MFIFGPQRTAAGEGQSLQYTKTEVRNRILASAQQEFYERGYEGAAMRSIAAASGSSLGNLYRYYANKQELYAAVVGGVVDECVERTERLFDISPAGLERSASAMVDFVGENREVFNILVSGPAEYYADFLRRFSESLSHRIKAYAEKEGAQAMSVITNPGFFDAVALGCIASLRPLMESFEQHENLKAHVLELWRFLFSDFIGRLERMHGSDVSL